MSTIPDDYKICAICQNPKHLSEFYRCKKSARGVQSYCKLCRNEYDQKDRFRRKSKLLAGGVVIPEFKQCNTCMETLPSASFYLSTQHVDGLRPKCRKCFCKETAANKRKHWEESKPERSRRQKNANLKATYGISLDDYEAMLLDNDGRCQICNKEESWPRRGSLCVDHNHETGRIRGLLCASCNRALGGFMDDKEILASAIRYLEKYEP